MKNEPFVANGDMYRLLSDWPWPFASTKPDKLPGAGDLVFYRKGRPSTFGDRVHSRISDGYSANLEDLDVEPYPALSWKDFPILLDYYFKGWTVLPNFEFLDPQDGLDRIAAGAGMTATGVVYCLIQGVNKPRVFNAGRGEHRRTLHNPVWTRAVLNRTMGGTISGDGYLIWYKGQFEKNNPISQVARFALCVHRKLETASHERRMRGYHPGHCTRCGLDMFVDSSD